MPAQSPRQESCGLHGLCERKGCGADGEQKKCRRQKAWWQQVHSHCDAQSGLWAIWGMWTGSKVNPERTGSILVRDEAYYECPISYDLCDKGD